MDLKAMRASPSVKARPDRKRVGRGPGSGMGKRATRGQKGAGARSGWHLRDFYEGGQMPLQRRIPKRGFSNDPFQTRLAVINVEALNRFDDGTEVTIELLKKSGLVKQALDGVKVLGDGELTKKLVVRASRFSKSAAEKIAARGGEAVTLLPPTAKRKRPLGATKKAIEAAAKAAAAPAKKKEKPEQAEKGEKPEKAAKPEKGEKPAGEKPPKPPKPEKGEKPEKGTTPQKPEAGEK